MSTRLLPFALLISLAGCSAGEQAAPKAAVPLTHQWNVPPGVTLFTQNNLGSEPAAAAEALMPSMPNIVYRLGERCKDDPAFAKPGNLTIEFRIEASTLSEIALQPASTGAECVKAALAEEFAAEEGLAKTDPARVLLYLEHAPVVAAAP